MNQVSLALDGVLTNVAELAGAVHEGGSRTIRVTGTAVIIVSVLLILLVLFIERFPARSAVGQDTTFPQQIRGETSSFLTPTRDKSTIENMSERQV
ncbi:MAG: hypothetical protein ACT4OO_07450 [Nitrospiraceae bacterium]